jgi:hypothetical protein
MADRVVVAAIVAQEHLCCAFFAGSIGATLIGVAFAPSPYPDLVLTVMGDRSGWVNLGSTALALA